MYIAIIIPHLKSNNNTRSLTIKACETWYLLKYNKQVLFTRLFISHKKYIGIYTIH